jgi:hypothetical protein
MFASAADLKAETGELGARESRPVPNAPGNIATGWLVWVGGKTI